MKQFKTILRFELNNYFQNKVFLGITIFAVLLIAVLMFFPRFAADKESGGAENAQPAKSDLPIMYIISETEKTEAIVQAFQEAFTDYNVTGAQNEDETRNKIISGEADCAFIIHSLTDYTYLVGNLTMYDTNTATADSVLQ